jgi:hypothetical protein
MITIRLTLSILLLAGVAAAHGRYQRLDTADFANAAAYQGQLVVLTADICAVSADRKSVQLFDNQSKTFIQVDLTQLERTQRNALLFSPVRRISVYGRVAVAQGRMNVEAHRLFLHANDTSGRMAKAR